MKIHRLNLNNAFGKLCSIGSLFAVLALVLCTSFDAHAQVITAAVRGTVTDPQGAAVAGADVSVTNVDTGFTRVHTASMLHTLDSRRRRRRALFCTSRTVLSLT